MIQIEHLTIFFSSKSRARYLLIILADRLLRVFRAYESRVPGDFGGFMKRLFQPLWLLNTLALCLGVGVAMSAPQNTPQQGQSPNQQTQPAVPPGTAQPAAPPTSDEPAPPPQSDQTTAPPASSQSSPATQSPSSPPASSQTPDQSAPPSSSPATPGSAPPGSAPQGSATQPGGVQSFSGTIVKQGDKCVLQEEATGQAYDLDHQDEVQKFVGKRVRVHGTLDPSGKLIHLQ